MLHVLRMRCHILARLYTGHGCQACEILYCTDADMLYAFLRLPGAITACGNAVRPVEAVALLRRMQEEGIEPTVVPWTAAISACGKVRVITALLLTCEVYTRSVMKVFSKICDAHTS